MALRVVWRAFWVISVFFCGVILGGRGLPVLVVVLCSLGLPPKMQATLYPSIRGGRGGAVCPGPLLCAHAFAHSLALAFALTLPSPLLFVTIFTFADAPALLLADPFICTPVHALASHLCMLCIQVGCRKVCNMGRQQMPK